MLTHRGFCLPGAMQGSHGWYARITWLLLLKVVLNGTISSGRRQLRLGGVNGAGLRDLQ